MIEVTCTCGYNTVMKIIYVYILRPDLSFSNSINWFIPNYTQDTTASNAQIKLEATIHQLLFLTFTMYYTYSLSV